jgi:hypothetical protein
VSPEVHKQFVNDTIDDLVGFAHKGNMTSHEDRDMFKHTIDALTMFLDECKKAQITAATAGEETAAPVETPVDPDKKYVTARFSHQDTVLSLPSPWTNVV